MIILLRFFFLKGILIFKLLIIVWIFWFGFKKYLFGVFFVKFVLLGLIKYGKFLGMILLKRILLIVVIMILCFCFFV